MKNEIPLDDFNVFLHELRTRELRKIPTGAKIFLSGGCAGTWYFDWLNNNYSGIKQHIGIEAYQSKPPDLQQNVLWIANTLSNMEGVSSSKVDLVFAGQTVEHLWPDELVGFLCEANRVLKENGLIVLDSPNRRITRGLRWHQPEHTIELNVEEISELLTLAGFTNIKIKGVWLCYDSNTHSFLPLDPKSNVNGWDHHKRISAAVDHPEDSFCWWVEAQKTSTPDYDKLILRTIGIFEEIWPLRVSRIFNQIGEKTVKNNKIMIKTAKGEKGALIHGPYIALRPGKYRVSFKLGFESKKISDDEIVAVIDVFTLYDDKFIAKKEIKFLELESNKLKSLSIDFEIAKVEFGIEFRLWSTGKIPLTAIFSTSLENLDTSI